MPLFDPTLLNAVESRHGPLHTMVVVFVDQWRWKRQLIAIANNPKHDDFFRVCWLHDRIAAIDPDTTTVRHRLALRRAWQRASNALAPRASMDERVWLANHRLAAF